MTHMEVGHSGALLAALAELTAGGMPLAQALPAFTSNPAGLLRWPGKGRIAAGADADLVVLDHAGPDSTGAAHTVIIGGIVHLAAGRRERAGHFEGA